MEVHLPRRRNRYSRPLLIGGVSLVAVAAIVGKYRKPAAEQHAAAPSTQPHATTQHAGPLVIAAPDFTKPQAPSPKPEAVAKTDDKKTEATKADNRVAFFDAPTTRPALALASRPAPTTPVDAAALFKAVDAKLEADDLVGARDALVKELDTKKFTPAENEAALERLQKLNDTLVFDSRKFVSDPHQTAYTVVAGDNLQKIANKFDVTIGFLQRVNKISDPRKLRLGQSLKVVKGPFHAVVNKSTFTLDLYQGKPGEPGSVFLKRLRVGLGENDSTPTGTWKIGTKLMNPTYYNSRNEGPRVMTAEDPKNPLGERWLALDGTAGQAVGKESYGIHGTIDPASIGKMMSMGCIRLLNEDVNLVYDMLIKDKSTVIVTE